MDKSAISFFFFFFGVNFVVLLLGTISLQDISGFESSPLLQGIKKKKLHNKLHNFKFQARSYLFFSFQSFHFNSRLFNTPSISICLSCLKNSTF